jgi:DNA-binding CsgD family transcriptional regulator
MGNPLAKREVEIMRLVVKGMTDMQISRELGISYKTAQNHMSHILKKLGVRSRYDAVRLCQKNGLVDPDKCTVCYKPIDRYDLNTLWTSVGTFTHRSCGRRLLERSWSIPRKVRKPLWLR